MTKAERRRAAALLTALADAAERGELDAGPVFIGYLRGIADGLST